MRQQLEEEVPRLRFATLGMTVHHNLPASAASYILRISGTPAFTGLPPAVGSTAAISANLSRWLSLTPSSARVCGMPIWRRRSSAPFHETVEGRVAQVEPARQALDLLVDGRPVELQHIGHGDGVGEAVMRVEGRAHRMRQRMDGAQPLLEGGRAHLRGRQHVAARLDVAAVLDRTRQVLLHQPHALDGDAFGIGMVAGRAVGFEAVDEGIHAGAGGELGRQADRQLGIGNDDRRHHLGMEDHLLGVRLLVGDHRGAAGLRAGAGGRRHGDRGIDPGRIGARPPVADILEVPHRPRLAGHEGDRLGGVDARAAAPGDHAVMLAGAQHCDAGFDVARDRIGLHVAEQRDLEPALRSATMASAIIGSLARPGSVTSSGRLRPTALQASGSSRMRPAPKRIAVG